MAFTMKVQLTGAREAIARLRAIANPKTQERVLKKAVRAGARIIEKDAEKRAPYLYGLLRKAMAVRVRVYRGGEFVMAIIGPEMGHRVILNGKPVDPVRYAHLQEYGTQHSAANPFLRPALDSKGAAAAEKMRTIIEAELSKEMSSAAA